MYILIIGRVVFKRISLQHEYGIGACFRITGTTRMTRLSPLARLWLLISRTFVYYISFVHPCVSIYWSTHYIIRCTRTGLGIRTIETRKKFHYTSWSESRFVQDSSKLILLCLRNSCLHRHAVDEPLCISISYSFILCTMQSRINTDLAQLIDRVLKFLGKNHRSVISFFDICFPFQFT